MERKELIDNLKQASEGFDSIANCCIEYAGIKKFDSIQQPKVAKKCNDSKFSMEELKSFSKGEYNVIDSESGNDENQYDLNIKGYSRQAFTNEIKPPIKKESERQPSPPCEPRSPLGDYLASFLSWAWICFVISLVLVIIFTSNLINRTGTIKGYEKEAERLNAEKTKIESLFETPEYISWKELWNGSTPVNSLIEQWETVEQKWQSIGYPVTKTELTADFEEAKRYDGTVRLSDLESQISYRLRSSLEFDEEAIRIDNGVYSVDNQFKDTFLIGEFWVLEVISCIALLVFLFFWFAKKDTSLKEVIDYPKLKEAYEQSKKEYEEITLPNWQAKIDEYEETYQEELKDYDNKVANAKSNHDKTERKKVLAKREAIKAEANAYVEILSKYEHDKKKYDQDCAKKKKVLVDKFNKAVEKIKANEVLPAHYKKLNEKKFLDGEEILYYLNVTIRPLELDVNDMIDILEKEKADTMKEVMNCLDTIKFQREQRELARKAERERREADRERQEELEEQSRLMIEKEITELKVKLKNYRNSLPQFRNYDSEREIERKIDKLENKLREMYW